MHVEKAFRWLANEAYPFWLERGIDQENGGFHEALGSTGLPAPLPQRAMVQARQIFSFRLAEKLGMVETVLAAKIVRQSTEHLITNFALPDASLVYTVGYPRKVLDANVELYTQAFGIFGLAQAYSLVGDEKFKAHAQRMVTYLRGSRQAKGGGYTEIKGGQTVYQSNPHMHLFEAALAWMQVDTDPLWTGLADELLDLLLTRFIDAETGALCEHFTENWMPERTEGSFVFEPGHHFEWAWLVGVYQAITGRTGLERIRHQLFDLAEEYGIDPVRRAAVDQVWSHFEVKKASSRFWPHCERIKAAVQLGAEAKPENRARYALIADEAVGTLFRYLDAPLPGLWRDTWTEAGEFVGDPVKSSSLYHIAGALAEYIRGRPQLGNIRGL